MTLNNNEDIFDKLINKFKLNKNIDITIPFPFDI